MAWPILGQTIEPDHHQGLARSDGLQQTADRTVTVHDGLVSADMEASR